MSAPAAPQARADRFARFQTVDVPRLRVVGMAFNAVGVLLHNYLIWGPPSGRDLVVIPTVLLGYALGTWVALLLLWRRIRGFDLAELFLVTDIGVLAFVVYVSGGAESLLWPVFLARPADQVATTYRRAMFFAHLGPLTFLGLMAWIARVDHHAVAWAPIVAKAVFLYFMALYIAFTARAAEAGRRKLADARRIAEAARLEADERRRALEVALSQLEAASRSKSEFLANVSHELRTPLNSVLGSADLLLDTPLTRDQRDMVGVLRDSADAVTHIVNDILDLARIEARRMPLEQIPMRLREVAGATLRMFSARVANRSIDLVCHVDPDVPDGLTGDPVRLRQVLTNLIGNAVKFTESGEIVLTVSRDETAGANDGRLALRFAVRDTGIGIPVERQTAIFEAFTQADGSSTRKYGGTGLGLTIANDLVGLMGGRLWVESEPGAGSTFAFIARFGTTPVTEPAPWGPRPLRALVVDPHGPCAQAAAALLTFWGAAARVVPGGHAALTAVTAAADAGLPWDLVLIDAALEGLTAAELAARLQATGAPVIVYVIRGPRAPAAIERALDGGALAIAKPVTASVLADVLRTAFGTATPSAAAARPMMRPLRVLVADDHEMNQAVAAAVLKKWGHAVAAAFTGEDALEKLAAAPYDVVLMDLQMPILDGLDATRRLRQREAATGAPRLPVLAMTARALDEDRDRCLAAGMDGFLSKPLDQRALFDALAAIAGNAAPAPLTPLTRATPDTPTTLAPMLSDPGLVRHLAELFLSTSPGQIEKLGRALDLGDAAQVRAVAHALKGAIAYFAGEDTSHAAAIESHAEAGHLDAARVEFDRLVAGVAHLDARLRAFLDGLRA